MMDNESLWAAARDAIDVVEEDRRGGRPGPAAGGFHTLEGAVANAMTSRLNEPFEDTLRRAVDHAREEEAGMRLGQLDPRDLADYDPEAHEFHPDGPTEPQTLADRYLERLRRAIEDLESLRGHSCSFDPETDYCAVCGADGRA